MLTELLIPTPTQGLHEITDRVTQVIAAARGRDGDGGAGLIREGLCTLLIQHTSASLLIQENADPSAKADLEAWLARIAPEGDPAYTHRAEGPDDMPSHLRAAITPVSLSIPIQSGRLALGRWQGVYVWEHRRGPASRKRTVLVHVMDTFAR